MIYGYIRVSTDHQTTENQRFEIKKFCEKQDIVIDCWVEETVSSTKDLNKRRLGRLLQSIFHKIWVMDAQDMKSHDGCGCIAIFCPSL